MDEIHTMLCQQKVLIEHNSTRIDAQQKHLTTSELDSAERILKLNGIGEVFKCYDKDMSKQKKAVSDWIYDNLHKSLHRYGCITITPILPKFGNPYVMLTFRGVSNARHFEHTVATLRKNKEIGDKVYTTRWSVNSRALVAGDFHTINYIQQDIAKNYNVWMNRYVLDYKLVDHHIGMIQVNTSQCFVKGKQHILIDFIDPCDGVTVMLWYMGQDPFFGHDYNKDISNPKTWEKADKEKDYSRMTLKDQGLWKRKPRLNK